jgi:purine-binding chemotaxis protein CheW
LAETGSYVVCRVGSRFCALPVADVSETMLILPIEPIAGAPPFVLGLSILRGSPVPVVDAHALLGGAHRESAPAKLVAVKLDRRIVALAVDAVVGVRALPSAAMDELPRLLRDVAAEIVEVVSTLDAELMLVLKAARVVPPAIWSAIDRGSVR